MLFIDRSARQWHWVYLVHFPFMALFTKIPDSEIDKLTYASLANAKISLRL